MAFRTWPEIVEMKDKEIDALKARVDELESLVAEASDLFYDIHSGEYQVDSLTDQPYRTALNRTPAQSLASIKARALRDEAKEWQDVGSEGSQWTNKEVAEELNLSADRIEQEGS